MKKKSANFVIYAVVFSCLLLFCEIVSGGGETRASAAAYTYKTYTGKSEVTLNTGSGSKSDSPETVLNFSYRIPQLSGSSSVSKKINKWFSDRYNEFMNSEKTYADNAKTDYQASKLMSPYEIRGKWTVACNSRSFMSFRYIYTADTGAAETQTITDTVTFSLKTGKQLYINDFVSGNTSQIRKKILKAYRRFEKSHREYTMWNTNQVTLKSTALKDLPFYLNKKKEPALYFAPRALAPAAAGTIVINI